MPRVTTWKVPVGLWLFGYFASFALRVLGGDTAAPWVGGSFGFLALVTAGLYFGHRSHAWKQSRQARNRERARYPEP